MHGQVVPYSASVPVPRCNVDGWVGVVVVVVVMMMMVVVVVVMMMMMVVVVVVVVMMMMMMMMRFLLDGGLMGFSEKVLQTMIAFSRSQESAPSKRVFMTASPL